MPIVDLKTVKLNYEILGDPALPTVLLIMGLSMPASAWPDKFIEQLLVRGLGADRDRPRSAENACTRALSFGRYGA